MRVLLLLLVATNALAEVPKLEVTLLTELAFDKGVETQVSAAPDATYRSQRWEGSIYHSGRSLTGFHGLVPGSAICVRGEACERDRGTGVQAYYNVFKELEAGPFDDHETLIQVGGGPVITAFEDFELGIKVGTRVAFRYGIGLFELEPHAIVGAAGRDTFEDSIFVPIRISLLTYFGIETGFASPLDNMGDRFAIPVSVYGRAPIHKHLLVVAAFTLPAAGGAAADTGASQRAATLGLQYLTY
jgi:hypothetical protein